MAYLPFHIEKRTPQQRPQDCHWHHQCWMFALALAVRPACRLWRERTTGAEPTVLASRRPTRRRSPPDSTDHSHFCLRSTPLFCRFCVFSPFLLSFPMPHTLSRLPPLLLSPFPCKRLQPRHACDSKPIFVSSYPHLISSVACILLLFPVSFPDVQAQPTGNGQPPKSPGHVPAK